MRITVRRLQNLYFIESHRNNNKNRMNASKIAEICSFQSFVVESNYKFKVPGHYSQLKRCFR